MTCGIILFFKKWLGFFLTHPRPVFLGKSTGNVSLRKPQDKVPAFFRTMGPVGFPWLSKTLRGSFLFGFPGWENYIILFWVRVFHHSGMKNPQTAGFILWMYFLYDFPLFMFWPWYSSPSETWKYFYFGFTRPIYMSWTHRNAPSTLGFIDLGKLCEFAIKETWFLPYGFSRSVLLASCGCIFFQAPQVPGRETCVFCHQDKMRPFVYEGLSLLPAKDDETWSQNTKRTNTLVVFTKYVSCQQMCCINIRPTKSWHPQKEVQLPPKRTATQKKRSDISLGKW